MSNCRFRHSYSQSLPFRAPGCAAVPGNVRPRAYSYRGNLSDQENGHGSNPGNLLALRTCRYPPRQGPPAPTFQDGLAQGVGRVNPLSTNLLSCRPTPPAPTFFIERATGAPLRCHDRHIGLIHNAQVVSQISPEIEPCRKINAVNHRLRGLFLFGQ